MSDNEEKPDLGTIDPLAVVMSPEQRREERIREAYEIFKREAEVDSVMGKDEYERKYAVLYNKELRERYLAGQLSEAEITTINRLSSEFFRKVNTQRPIHIVDEVTHKEVYTLPPLFATLQVLKGDDIINIDVFHNVHDNEADRNDPISKARVAQSAANLNKAIAQSQDVEDLMRQRERFNEMAQTLNETVNKPYIVQAQEQAQELLDKKIEETSDSVDAEMEFAPIDDDDE